MLINSTDFYANYQVNYYDYKQLSLKFLIENLEAVELKDKILNYSENDYLRTIKSEIRQTYLHSIETTFDLIFALAPTDKNGGIIRERSILETLSKRTFHYEKIRKIATQADKSLDFLNCDVKLKNGERVEFIHFLFYRNLELTEEIQDSINTIKFCLILLANDLSDRNEYNSYKHALKIFPNFHEININNPENESFNKTLDLSDSLTFFCKDKKTEEESLMTKVFDTKRDLNMTSISSDLIWNIIMPRKVLLSRAKFSADYINIVLFKMNEILKKSKRNIKADSFKITFRPE